MIKSGRRYILTLVATVLAVSSFSSCNDEFMTNLSTTAGKDHICFTVRMCDETDILSVSDHGARSGTIQSDSIKRTDKILPLEGDTDGLKLYLHSEVIR